MTKKQLEAMWGETLVLAKRLPYAYSSKKYAHTEAAHDVAKQHGLNDDQKAEFKKYVQDKTATFSNYAGD